MLGRQSVRVTYAHKKRRIQHENRKLPSSPLEVLPPVMDNLTRTHMTRRMLKRSRRVALTEQSEDKNVDHIRERLAKRIKCNQERISDVEPSAAPFHMPSQDIVVQTPFPSSRSVHKSPVAKLPVSEPLSPVPPAKQIVSRTSSRNFKENNVHSQTLASPFSSHPGSTASSPKYRARARSSHRALRTSLYAKARTFSGVFREDSPRVIRKLSTTSLEDTNREPRPRYIKHHRHLSTPLTAYMRSQSVQDDWIVSSETLSGTFDDYEVSPSGCSIHSHASFHAAQPQSYSTPATTRLQKALDLLEARTGIDSNFDSLDATGGLDAEMIGGTVFSRQQTIHLPGDSIFSSFDDFTTGLPPELNNATTAGMNAVTDRGQALADVDRQISISERAVAQSAGSFVAEYDVPLSDATSSPASTTTTKMLGSICVPKLSVGEQSFHLSGTSPAHDGALIIRTCRKPGTRTPQTSLSKTTTSCSPSSPASDMIQEFSSMDIRGDMDMHSDGETYPPCGPVALVTRSISLQDVHGYSESATKKCGKRMSTRNRASTIRASDFVRPGPAVSSSGGAPGFTSASLTNVRRTRSGTVVGPESKLATKGAAGLVAVQCGSESESGSDDELLLSSAWIEDLEYLGLAVPADKNAEADELNLGGPWSGPPRRLGLRRR